MIARSYRLSGIAGSTAPTVLPGMSSNGAQRQSRRPLTGYSEELPTVQ